MVNQYFSIGEVSRIRGVGIKSLRYYDRVGVLKPAYVNPETGYRYYAIEQLFDLDVISLCIELGIPLRSLQNYLDDNNSLKLELLLSDGKKLAEEKIRRMQHGLQIIEKLTDSVTCGREHKNGDIYERELPERQILLCPFEEKYNSDSYILKLSKLFLLAQQLGITATYQSGLLYEFSGGAIEKHLFVEILPQQKESNRIRTIPGGRYRCFRTDQSCIDRSKELFPDVFAGSDTVTMLETELFESTINYGRFALELQVISHGFDLQDDCVPR